MNPQMQRQFLMNQAANPVNRAMAAAPRMLPYAAGAAGVGALALGTSALMGGGDNRFNAALSAEDAYQQQLVDQVAVAERAGQFKRDLEAEAAEQAYNQQMGLANATNQHEMGKVTMELKARAAEALLNGHLDALAEGRQAAASAGSARFY